MKMFKLLDVILFVLLVLLVIACVYGVVTDCPNTEGYVYCGKGELPFDGPQNSEPVMHK
jgi:hypothetical protein